MVESALKLVPVSIPSSSKFRDGFACEFSIPELSCWRLFKLAQGMVQLLTVHSRRAGRSHAKGFFAILHCFVCQLCLIDS